MNAKVYAQDQATELLPLLRSIGREIKDRTRAIDALEEDLSHCTAGTEPALREAGDTRAELAVQRRELSRAQRELERLGCRLDADHPLRILIPGLAGTMAYEGSLERTAFRFRPGLQRT